MDKKHIVRLTKRQREVAERVVEKLEGSPRKVKRAPDLAQVRRARLWLD